MNSVIALTHPTEDELARILPRSIQGAVTFHGWAPVQQPVMILKHVSSNRVLYLGMDGHEYRFRPHNEEGGALLQGGARERR